MLLEDAGCYERLWTSLPAVLLQKNVWLQKCTIHLVLQKRVGSLSEGNKSGLAQFVSLLQRRRYQRLQEAFTDLPPAASALDIHARADCAVEGSIHVHSDARLSQVYS